MPVTTAYIIAARRTALGRIGGLHRNRRIAELAAPVVSAALADCGVAPEKVEELIVGNATEGGNPARLIALASGLGEASAAATIDRQCGSGLDAILAAIRSVTMREAEIIVAGGAEAISTAPWRIAKPRSLYQIPRFLAHECIGSPVTPDLQPFESSEELTRKLGISRARQDTWAVQSHMRAEVARSSRRFVGEILPLRANAGEARDESAVEPGFDDLVRMTPFLPPEGTLTPGNTSAIHDGAAFVVVVSERIWIELGKPGALRLVASAAKGVSPDNEAGAPIEAMRKLYDRLNGAASDIARVEMSESSAVQAIAFAETFGMDESAINPDGGAVVRGHPFGAAGAVLVVRLFTGLVRGKSGDGASRGVAALGTLGGMGIAALFESV